VLVGSGLDLVDDPMGQAFKVKNPNAVASCGSVSSSDSLIFEARADCESCGSAARFFRGFVTFQGLAARKISLPLRAAGRETAPLRVGCRPVQYSQPTRREGELPRALPRRVRRFQFCIERI
jgi:hypothetical protein